MNTKLIRLISIAFIVLSGLIAFLICKVHAEETNRITQITQDLPKCVAISDELFGQDSLIQSHGVEVSTKYSFCDGNGQNCGATYVIGARG